MLLVLAFLVWNGLASKNTSSSRPTDRDDILAHPAMRARSLVELGRRLSVFGFRVTRDSRLYRVVAKDASGVCWTLMFVFPEAPAPELLVLLSERRVA